MAYRPTLEQFELIFDNTFDSIFLIGVEGEDRYRILSVNPRLADVTGRKVSDLVGHLIDDLYDDKYLAYLKRQYGDAIAYGRPSRYETRTDMASTEVYIDTTLAPIFDAEGNATHLIGVSRDITRNKLERKALLREKQRAENYLNIAEAIILALDLEANITLLNRKGYQMLGYPEGSLTGRNWCDLCIAPEKREAFRAQFHDALKTGNVLNGVNYLLRCNGERILVSWANSLIYNDSGRTIGVLSSGEDITDRHQAEKAMISSQRLLAAEEVVAEVAHDFNNSLQGILGNIDLVLATSALSPDIRSLLETAARLTEDATSRIRRLQTAGATREAATYEPIPINELVEEVIEETRHLWWDEATRLGKQLTVYRNLSDGATAVMGNRSELRTVIYNVVKNAIEAIAGDGSLTFETRGGLGKNVIAVIDTGCGMDFETSSRVFQPFFSTKGLESGRGLGMSASHGIIRLHGGGIEIRESSPGHGTRVEIELPAVEVAVTSAEPYSTTAPETPEVEALHRILWVDDDPAVRKLAASFITGLGYTGDVAESGSQALEMLQQSSYSIIITDVGMPGMDGFELARRVRELDDSIAIIALTGWGDQAGEGTDGQSHVDKLLAKPVSLADLKLVLAEYQ